MTFTEIQKIFEDKFGTNRLADLARELGVTPQVVSNWKSRNQVPYKYIKILRGKIDEDVGATPHVMSLLYANALFAGIVQGVVVQIMTLLSFIESILEYSTLNPA